MKLKIIAFLIFLLSVMIVSCQNEDQLEFKRYYSSGSLLYQSNCQNCHGINGEGLKGLIPPLTDSVYLITHKALLACFIRNGLKGKINVSNRLYEGQMPQGNLTNVAIAEVLTYITNSFGNKRGTITSGQVNNDLAECL